MKKHEIVFRSYMRNHGGADLEEREKGKISRQRLEADRLERRTDAFLRQDAGVRSGDADQAMEEYEGLLHRTEIVRRGAKTHRERLRELVKNRDFL